MPSLSEGATCTRPVLSDANGEGNSLPYNWSSWLSIATASGELRMFHDHPDHYDLSMLSQTYPMRTSRFLSRSPSPVSASSLAICSWTRTRNRAGRTRHLANVDRRKPMSHRLQRPLTRLCVRTRCWRGLVAFKQENVIESLAVVFDFQRHRLVQMQRPYKMCMLSTWYDSRSSSASTFCSPSDLAI